MDATKVFVRDDYYTRQAIAPIVAVENEKKKRNKEEITFRRNRLRLVYVYNVYICRMVRRAISDDV